MCNSDNLINYTDMKSSYKHCVDNIVKIKKNKPFYIGATSNPDERLNDQTENRNMKTMYTLCKVPNKNKTISLEQKLIKRFNIKKCLNKGEGVEGIEDGENYIYVLFN